MSRELELCRGRLESREGTQDGEEDIKWFLVFTKEVSQRDPTFGGTRY